MSEVRFGVSFRSARRGSQCKGAVAIEGAAGKEEPLVREGDPGPARPVGRVARMLALAYYVERQVEAGAIKDYAEAARLLGLSRGRMTQVMDLHWLPRKAQEAILAGQMVSERRLRARCASGVKPH